MKLAQQDQESIVALLTRIYTDLREIETEFSLTVGGGDFRPRIEFFHDAIRAFSDQHPGNSDSNERLTIEKLAIDVKYLRELQAKPLMHLAPEHRTMAASGEVMAVTPDSLAPKPQRPDRVTRERLAELYQHYGVLFAALLKPTADLDFIERTDNLNQDVVDVNAVQEILEKFAQGKGDLTELVTACNHIEDKELHQLLSMFIQQQKYKSKDAITKLVAFLKIHIKQYDKDIKSIDNAHMHYAMSQLALYEESRDMLKKMAGQGLNLVGKFVENAMKETKREMGR
ncbi:MAG: hypothetical protein SFT92_02975 [Rickettsiales bacterium]|nr:hypothetical protein [Rickettsiales bacterium]